MNRQRRSVGWGMVIWLAWTVPSRASDSLAGLLACRDLADASARLTCFDREAAALGPGPRAPGGPAAVATAPATTTPTASRSAAPAFDPQQQFGLPEHAVVAEEVAAGTRAADAAKIEAHLSRFSTTPDGRVVFNLDNGQVWRQLLAEGDLMVKPGDDVTISRGMLGSYWLQLKSRRGCKVTRLR